MNSKGAREAIQTSENAVYVVVGGEIKKIAPPPTGFGKQVIIWQDNAPIRIECMYADRFNSE